MVISLSDPRFFTNLFKNKNISKIIKAYTKPRIICVYNILFLFKTQEITIPTTVTTIDTVFAASALTYLVTLY